MDNNLFQGIKWELILTLILIGVVLISVTKQMDLLYKTNDEINLLTKQVLELKNDNMQKEFQLIDTQYNTCRGINVTFNNKTLQMVSLNCSQKLVQLYLKKYYDAGSKQGYASAITQILNQSGNCKPFYVYMGNKTVRLINFECVRISPK